MAHPAGGSRSGAPDLGRFIAAQQSTYAQALSELRAGAKQSHWMWFIFPQLAGLGHSSTAQFYALETAEEARAYLAEPILGARLLQCTAVVMGIEHRTAVDIFGEIDALKFKSCMTLFGHLAGPDSLFRQALEKYFAGVEDFRTLELLQRP